METKSSRVQWPDQVFLQLEMTIPLLKSSYTASESFWRRCCIAQDRANAGIQISGERSTSVLCIPVHGECRVQLEYVTIDVGEMTHPHVEGRETLPAATTMAGFLQELADMGRPPSQPFLELRHFRDYLLHFGHSGSSVPLRIKPPAGRGRRAKRAGKGFHGERANGGTRRWWHRLPLRGAHSLAPLLGPRESATEEFCQTGSARRHSAPTFAAVVTNPCNRSSGSGKTISELRSVAMPCRVVR